MQFVNSTIGIDDDVNINDINYSTIPGPSFTPGVGGTYKESPPPFKPPVDTPAQWDVEEPSQGCANTLTAGWRTIDYCSQKPVTCQLHRPHEPQRHIEPGRLQLLKQQIVECKNAALKERNITMTRAINWALVIAGVYLIFMVLFAKR